LRLKKILYISYDGMTDPLGQSQVIPYLQGLTKQGIEFSLISFEKKEKFRERGEMIRSLLDISGIKWYPQTFTSNPPIVSKLFDLWRMKKAAVNLHKENQFDLIHCRSYVAIQAGLQLKKKFQIPVLFDMRGFWVDEKKEAGGLLWKILYKVYKNKERIFLADSDAIISLTAAAKKEILSWGLDKVTADKIAVIPCCTDLALFSPSVPDDNERITVSREIEAENRYPIISYLGSLGPQYSIKEMLYFFSRVKIKHPLAKFIFFTKDNPELVLKYVEQFPEIRNTDIHFRFVERNKVPAYLSASDYSIFFYYPSYSRLACSPTKYAELLGMNIPVICNEIGDISKPVVAGDCQIVLKDLSEKSLATAAEKIGNKDTKKEYKTRDYAIEHYSLDTGINSYFKVYKKLGL